MAIDLRIGDTVTITGHPGTHTITGTAASGRWNGACGNRAHIYPGGYCVLHEIAPGTPGGPLKAWACDMRLANPTVASDTFKNIGDVLSWTSPDQSSTIVVTREATRWTVTWDTIEIKIEKSEHRTEEDARTHARCIARRIKRAHEAEHTPRKPAPPAQEARQASHTPISPREFLSKPWPTSAGPLPGLSVAERRALEIGAMSPDGYIPRGGYIQYRTLKNLAKRGFVTIVGAQLAPIGDNEYPRTETCAGAHITQRGASVLRYRTHTMRELAHGVT